MWILEKKFRFEASHILPHHDGKCARLHGHSWTGAVRCKGKEIHQSGPQSGMLLDFTEMSSAVKELVESSLDHYHLNETTGLENPTSEELCRWIFERLKPKLPLLSSVILEETCTSRCEYTP